MFYEGSEGDTIRLPKHNTVESCVLLERVSKRKADSYVKLNVKMEDSYKFKYVKVEQ